MAACQGEYLHLKVVFDDVAFLLLGRLAVRPGQLGVLDPGQLAVRPGQLGVLDPGRLAVRSRQLGVLDLVEVWIGEELWEDFLAAASEAEPVEYDLWHLQVNGSRDTYHHQC